MSGRCTDMTLLHAEIGGVTGIRGDDSVSATEPLRRRYVEYRARQGRELLALIPREGLRSLIRAEREARGGDLDVTSANGLEILASRCEALLPLPPFDVWARDFHRNRRAHAGPDAPSITPTSPDRQPVTVDVREFRSPEGVVWVAALDLQGGDQRWTGAVRFHSPAASGVHRTGPILRETDGAEVRERFRSFDVATLRALLRSALP